MPSPEEAANEDVIKRCRELQAAVRAKDAEIAVRRARAAESHGQPGQSREQQDVTDAPLSELMFASYMAAVQVERDGVGPPHDWPFEKRIVGLDDLSKDKVKLDLRLSIPPQPAGANRSGAYVVSGDV